MSEDKLKLANELNDQIAFLESLIERLENTTAKSIYIYNNINPCSDNYLFDGKIDELISVQLKGFLISSLKKKINDLAVEFRKI